MHDLSDSYEVQSAETALRDFWRVLGSNLHERTDDTQGLYRDTTGVRTRLLKAELDEDDRVYLAAISASIRPNKGSDDLQRLREILLEIVEKGLTTELVDCTLTLMGLDTAKQRRLAWYFRNGRKQALKVFHLLCLRSDFWQVNHDRTGAFDVQALAIDPLNLPEATEENFRARRTALSAIDSMADDVTLLGHNVLLVLPWLLDDDTKRFFKEYDAWVDSGLY